MAWYAHWPEVPAFTPFGFARHWARMVRQLEQAAADTGGMMIEYEDLAAGRIDLGRLSDYCGVGIDGRTLGLRVGGSTSESTGRGLSTLERLLLALGRAAAR
jgi:hypothetical protein